MTPDQFRYRLSWWGRQVLQVNVSAPVYLPLIGARLHEERWRDATPVERAEYERMASDARVAMKG